MIKVSILYPNSPGSHFDMAYYVDRHMPMVRQKLGADLKGLAVDQCLAGGTAGAPPSYLAVGHLMFDSVDAFQRSFGPSAAAITGDIPNYTNTQPTVLISEIKL